MSLLSVPVTVESRASCSVSDVLHRIGDRWSVLVLSLVADRAYGFNELDRGVDGLSRRILTRTLRGLEREGLVDRVVRPGPVTRVEYAASPLGHSLLPLIVQVGEWVLEHEAELEAARARFDAKSAVRHVDTHTAEGCA